MVRKFIISTLLAGGGLAQTSLAHCTIQHPGHCIDDLQDGVGDFFKNPGQALSEGWVHVGGEARRVTEPMQKNMGQWVAGMGKIKISECDAVFVAAITDAGLCVGSEGASPGVGVAVGHAEVSGNACYESLALTATYIAGCTDALKKIENSDAIWRNVLGNEEMALHVDGFSGDVSQAVHDIAAANPVPPPSHGERPCPRCMIP